MFGTLSLNTVGSTACPSRVLPTVSNIDSDFFFLYGCDPISIKSGIPSYDDTITVFNPQSGTTDTITKEDIMEVHTELKTVSWPIKKAFSPTGFLTSCVVNDRYIVFCQNGFECDVFSRSIWIFDTFLCIWQQVAGANDFTLDAGNVILIPVKNGVIICVNGYDSSFYLLRIFDYRSLSTESSYHLKTISYEWCDITKAFNIYDLYYKNIKKIIQLDTENTVAKPSYRFIAATSFVDPETSTNEFSERLVFVFEKSLEKTNDSIMSMETVDVVTFRFSTSSLMINDFRIAYHDVKIGESVSAIIEDNLNNRFNIRTHKESRFDFLQKRVTKDIEQFSYEIIWAKLPKYGSNSLLCSETNGILLIQKAAIDEQFYKIKMTTEVKQTIKSMVFLPLDEKKYYFEIKGKTPLDDVIYMALPSTAVSNRNIFTMDMRLANFVSTNLLPESLSFMKTTQERFSGNKKQEFDKIKQNTKCGLPIVLSLLFVSDLDLTSDILFKEKERKHVELMQVIVDDLILLNDDVKGEILSCGSKKKLISEKNSEVHSLCYNSDRGELDKSEPKTKSKVSELGYVTISFEKSQVDGKQKSDKLAVSAIVPSLIASKMSTSKLTLTSISHKHLPPKDSNLVASVTMIRKEPKDESNNNKFISKKEKEENNELVHEKEQKLEPLSSLTVSEIGTEEENRTVEHKQEDNSVIKKDILLEQINEIKEKLNSYNQKEKKNQEIIGKTVTNEIDNLKEKVSNIEGMIKMLLDEIKKEKDVPQEKIEKNCITTPFNTVSLKQIKEEIPLTMDKNEKDENISKNYNTGDGASITESFQDSVIKNDSNFELEEDDRNIVEDKKKSENNEIKMMSPVPQYNINNIHGKIEEPSISIIQNTVDNNNKISIQNVPKDEILITSNLDYFGNQSNEPVKKIENVLNSFPINVGGLGDTNNTNITVKEENERCNKKTDFSDILSPCASEAKIKQNVSVNGSQMDNNNFIAESGAEKGKFYKNYLYQFANESEKLASKSKIRSEEISRYNKQTNNYVPISIREAISPMYAVETLRFRQREAFLPTDSNNLIASNDTSLFCPPIISFSMNRTPYKNYNYSEALAVSSSGDMYIWDTLPLCYKHETSDAIIRQAITGTSDSGLFDEYNRYDFSTVFNNIETENTDYDLLYKRHYLIKKSSTDTVPKQCSVVRGDINRNLICLGFDNGKVRVVESPTVSNAIENPDNYLLDVRFQVGDVEQELFNSLQLMNNFSVLCSTKSAAWAVSFGAHDAKSTKTLYTVENSNELISCMKRSIDGTQAIMGFSTGQSLLFDYSRIGCDLDSVIGSYTDTNGSYIRAVELSSTNSVLATGFANSYIKLWDIRSGKATHLLKGHSAQISQIAMNDTLICSGDDSGCLKIFDKRNTVKSLHSLKAHTTEITGLYLTGHGFVSSSLDGTILGCEFY